MQIKRFEAQNMSEALKQIKREFGPDAVILSVREVESGTGMFGFSKTKGIEVTAATDMQPYKNKIDRGYSSYEANMEHYPQDDSRECTRGLFPSFRSGANTAAKAVIPSSCGKKAGNRDTKQLYALYCQMLEQDVNQAVAFNLIRRTRMLPLPAGNPAVKNFRPFIVQGLNAAGICAGRIRIADGVQRRVALVGPTGVGKTTTIAKLAAAAQTRRNRQRVAIISLDENRVGAREQIAIYARIIGCPLKIASDRRRLERHLEDLNSFDLLLIDTPGMSQACDAQIREIRSIFDNIENVEFHLVLSAATSDNNLADMIEKYRIFQISRLIFTKLDECTTYGAILNRLFLSEIPASYFTNGQQIPEDIEPASVEKIVDLIFDAGGRKYLSGSPEELADKIIRFERMLAASGEPDSDMNRFDGEGTTFGDPEITKRKMLGGSRF